MHWMVNVTLLTLVGITAFLVLGRDWNMSTAFLVVGGCAVALVSAVLLAVLAIVKGEERQAVLREIRVTMKTDFDDFLRVLGIRR